MDSRSSVSINFANETPGFAKAVFNEFAQRTAEYYVLLMRGNIRIRKCFAFAFSARRIKTIARRRIASMG